MRKKAVSGTMLTLLLIGMLTLAFNIQPAKASGTIYIRADGSVEGTDKIQRDGDVYTFTGNIYDSLVVERDDIVVDGAGYTVQDTGAYQSKGIDLSYSNNVTLKNVEVTNFYWGIWLRYSSNNVLSGNTASNNSYGIYLEEFSDNNTLFHNNFINNTHQVGSVNSINTWDNGYPSGGNYWSDYTGTDADGDGIGDTSYVIDAYNRDRYPLMSPWGLVEKEEEVPFWMQWWFWAIVAIVIVASAGAVYLKKKKPPISTTPTPSEGTV